MTAKPDGHEPVHVSIVCPAYNEEAGIANAIALLRRCLDELPYRCEVLLVNDGSTDATVARATAAIGGDRRFRVLNHVVNFGRGRALRTGFNEARGEIIATTEGDMSWGHDIVGRMVEHLDRHPQLDAVLASPNVEGGGYRNVPWHRVTISRIGNRFLRALYLGKLTMTTGMTRAYRAWVVQGQHFAQDGKELHLEIAHRLIQLGYRIGEVPAILSWPDPVSGQVSRGKRTQWRKIFRLVLSHLSFGFFQGVARLIWPALLALTISIIFFGSWGVYNLFRGQPSIYLATLTGVQVILWVTLLVGLFVLQHVRQLEIELFRTQSMLASLARPDQAVRYERRYYKEIEPESPV